MGSVSMNKFPSGAQFVRFVLKHLIKIPLAITWTVTCATAQGVQHGTYFVSGFSTSYAVVAIDSRERTDGSVDDQHCKIKILSPNKAFVFSRGVDAEVARDKTRIFDADDVAKRLYIQFGIGTTRFPELADAWAVQMEKIYARNPAKYVRAAFDNRIVQAIFVGVDARGDVAVSAQTVRYLRKSDGSIFFTHTPDTIDFGDPAIAPTFVAGYYDLVSEFKDGGKTDRARLVLSKLDTSLQGADAVAARYMAYVEAVKEWSKDPAIGGETASIILDSQTGLHWFHRPQFCTGN